jgi:serine/threonine protein kinase
MQAVLADVAWRTTAFGCGFPSPGFRLREFYSYRLRYRGLYTGGTQFRERCGASGKALLSATVTQTANRLPVPLGTVLQGTYRLEEVVGGGGMGTVVRARHLRLNHTVAIKFVLTSKAPSEGIEKRFEREAHGAAQLKSPFVVRTLDFDRLEDGTPYLVLEHLEGESLTERVVRLGPLPQAQVKVVLKQVACAMIEAHQQGLVHRDLSANNLFFTELPNGDPFVRVLDFGLAKLAVSPNQYETTNRNVLLGSPPYMAPELIRRGTADARTDIWSLGVAAYFMLSGSYPFVGESPADTFVAILSTPPEELDAHISVSRALRALVYRCLRKEPAERPQTMIELCNAVQGGDSPAEIMASADETRDLTHAVWRK